MTKKVGFAAGLGNLERLGGKVATPLAPASPATVHVVGSTEPAGETKPGGRSGKVNIAGYFDPAVRKQLAMLAIELETDQVKLMAEALNMLFEKHGRSPIAAA
ncbi:ribbon-helix-helix domain-containing protein [Sphingomonas sp. CFBP 8760]|uniref:ribbon-helix-helix domain-containing protein n=1 Tax=Sphingomonas sp. CFBP 8760 TaxID=2775282 RepID=UPI00177F9537|nr:ribbon-helix-helix domain-containing protein [Sphingomonas sp. CFBP 8760]MBD8546683.1 hypothetical protein [Sphingomonas sp. CFBP 8760]